MSKNEENSSKLTRSITPPILLRSDPSGSMTPLSGSPIRSKSPVKNLFSLKFSPKRNLPDNSPISPTDQSKSNPNSPKTPSSPHSPNSASSSPQHSPHPPNSPHGPSSPHSPHPPNSPHTLRTSGHTPNMMSSSPMRLVGLGGNNQSAPETPNMTPRAPVLLKSISSPRQRRSSFSTFGLFMRSSPPKKGSNLLNSSDEIRRSSLSESPPPLEIQYMCHQCRRNLTIDKEKGIFLAVKCDCDGPPCYFCTRECYISHWITRNTRGLACSYNKFETYLKKMNQIAPHITFPLASPLEWDDQEHIHQISEYLSTTYID
jgi:hypothetical protein